MTSKEKNQIALTHKICKDCGQYMHMFNDFHKAGKDRNGEQRYKSDCKKCRSIKNKKAKEINNKLDQETKYNMHLCMDLEPVSMPKKVNAEKVAERLNTEVKDDIDRELEEEVPKSIINFVLTVGIIILFYLIFKYSLLK